MGPLETLSASFDQVFSIKAHGCSANIEQRH